MRQKKIDSLDAKYWKVMSTYHLKQRDIKGALQAVEKSIAIDPDDYFTWLNLGILKQVTWKYADAEKALLNYIQLDSN